MLNLKLATKPSMLDAAIDEALAQLSGIDIDTDLYAKKVEQLTRLYALKEKNSPKRISPDTLAIVLGNLAGIVLIINHERLNVVTTKALGFVMKAR